MTHQGSLDTFWQSPDVADSGLVDAFVRALAGTIQVKGDFFSAAGQASAIATFVERLVHGTINGSGAFVDPPPRVRN
jgi:capsular polysaccharide export protein